MLPFSLALLLMPGNVFSAQITIDSDEQFRFAEQTMEKGDYLRAVVEFERFLQFFPEDKKVPKARLLIAQCYLKAKDYESARKILNEVLNVYKGTLVGGKALFLMGESYYEQGLYEEAERYFKGVLGAYSEPELRNSAVYRLGWIQMQTGKWQEASETFKTVGAGSPLFLNAQDLSAKSLGGEHLALQGPDDRRRHVRCARDLGTPTVNATKTVWWPFSSTGFSSGPPLRPSTKTRKCWERFWGLSSWASTPGRFTAPSTPLTSTTGNSRMISFRDCLMPLISISSPPKKATSALP